MIRLFSIHYSGESLKWVLSNQGVGGEKLNDLAHAEAVINYGIARFLIGHLPCWHVFRLDVTGMLTPPCEVNLQVRYHEGVEYCIRPNDSVSPWPWCWIEKSDKPYTREEVEGLWRRAYRSAA